MVDFTPKFAPSGISGNEYVGLKKKSSSCNKEQGGSVELNLFAEFVQESNVDSDTVTHIPLLSNLQIA